MRVLLTFQDLQLNNKMPVYMQIALHVKRRILLKWAVSGDKLPSRRDIAMQLNINPNTVQKAFKLMEDEGYVRTSSTTGSVIYLDDEIYGRIETELTKEMVAAFIAEAKEANLSFKKTVELLTELWE
ncbi:MULTISPECIES: GntR family transcriptional regulator [Paenibacillus]|uniref:GntR family transcriptional regulator n=1 Tax=Paenibacillus TaxID=44249 RepID=UPI000FDA1A4C|nr:GntR family transcriptional regulator [Paenibacillus glycanilyticus]MCK9858768.1 GntR family transcriptional regulator [Paenibacillus sp. ATY16]